MSLHCKQDSVPGVGFNINIVYIEVIGDEKRKLKSYELN